MERNKVITGARVRFQLEGVTIGYARDVRLTEEVMYEPLEVLGNVEVEEYVPTAYRVRFSAGMFRIIGESLKTMGVFPKNVVGATETHIGNILTTGELSAVLEDTVTSEILFTVEQVKITTVNYTVNARGIMGEDVEFVAIRVRDAGDAKV
jgi:hypothetical protein